LPYIKSALYVLDITRKGYVQSMSSSALPMSKEVNVRTCYLRLALKQKTYLRRVIRLGMREVRGINLGSVRDTAPAKPAFIKRCYRRI
jgi:hypothetical protein